MKKYITILIFVLALNNAFAQTIEVVAGLNSPCGMQFNGDELYFSELGNEPSTANKLLKINVNTANPVIDEVLGNLNDPNVMLLVGEFLYIAEYTGNKIVKINITQSNPIVITVVSSVNHPRALAFKDDFLYVALFDLNKVVKYNITLDNPTPIDVATGLNRPSGLIFNNNDLYIAERFGDKISKIEINSTSTSVDNFLYISDPVSLQIRYNELYISQPSENKISKVNLDQPFPTIGVVADLGYPAEILIRGDELYISEYGADKISKFLLNSLSTVETSVESIVLAPNPVENALFINGLFQITQYKIYDIYGRILKSGKVTIDAPINCQHLVKGMYIVQLDNGFTQTVIKK